MPTLIAEYRSRILQVGVYVLPVLISALYPCSHRNSLLVGSATKPKRREVPRAVCPGRHRASGKPVGEGAGLRF